MTLQERTRDQMVPGNIVRIAREDKENFKQLKKSYFLFLLRSLIQLEMRYAFGLELI
jgi:uncharacterized protein (UPF0147 family)